MATLSYKIIIVDDEKSSLELMDRILSGASYQVITFNDPKKALTYCLANDFDVIISDLKMPTISGLELIQELKDKKDDFLAIMLSAYSDVESLVQALNTKLLFQYVLKPAEAPNLLNAVDTAFRQLSVSRMRKEESNKQVEELHRLRAENVELKFSATSPLDALVGNNPTVLKLREQIKSFSTSDHPVLILGEEGTGKKLVAKLVHELSGRKNKPYVSFNCGNVPEEILEAELFGVAKGGLPGVKADKDGFITAAQEGTLFLEELQNVNKTIQGKILRLIQYGTYHPVGSTAEKAADVRVLLSAKTTLQRDVQDGKFRKDLYYKISNLTLKTSALRERRDDILSIIESLAANKERKLPIMEPGVKEALTRYAFPGNIRELEGILDKLIISASSNEKNKVTMADLDRILQENIKIYALEQGDDAVVRTIHLPTGREVVDLRKFVDHIECDVIENSLKYNDFNISQTARMLMISRQGLKNKINRYGLEQKYKLTGGEEDTEGETEE